MSQKAFADLCGVNPAHVSQVERGYLKSAERIRQIAGGLGWTEENMRASIADTVEDNKRAEREAEERARRIGEARREERLRLREEAAERSKDVAPEPAVGASIDIYNFDRNTPVRTMLRRVADCLDSDPEDVGVYQLSLYPTTIGPARVLIAKGKLSPGR